MEPPERKPLDRKALAVDAVLTLAVFAYFTWVCMSHVPSNNRFDIWFWGAVTSSCITAVFWLALQMFRVVLRAQRAEHKKQHSD